MKPKKSAARDTTLAEIRRAVADYIATEGCSCCRDIEGHKAAEIVLAKLLRVRPHPDEKDYYDFSRYRTKAAS